jgi:hypothetical protein
MRQDFHDVKFLNAGLCSCLECSVLIGVVEQGMRVTPHGFHVSNRGEVSADPVFHNLGQSAGI